MAQIFQRGDVVADRFEIVRFIAEGGMGEVYEAQDQVLGGRIALKFLARHADDNARVQRRFRREIHLARQVTHGNVCRIFDVYQHKIVRGGRRSDIEITFVTMELLDGETLEEYLSRKGPLAEEEALNLVKQICRGMDAAHAAGVIHRDLKPSNVMLVPGDGTGDDPRVVVTDFGLARSTAPNATRTTPLTGELRLVGTADFMSPEQLRGEAVTTASDIYALGVVIFQMVTGRKPYEAANTLSLLTKRATEAPKSPTEYRPDLDENWVSVILACMENNPKARPPTAGDIAGLLGAESTELTRTMTLPQSWPPAPEPKSRTAAWISGMVIVLALGLAAGFFLRRVPPPLPRYDNTVQLTTAAGLEFDASFAPDGSALVYTSDRSGAFEIYRRDLGPGGAESQLTAGGHQSFEPVYSPDGQWIAFHSQGRRGLWLIPAAGGTPKRLTSEGSRPAFSPDGEWIVYQTQSNPQTSETSIGAIGASNLRLVKVDGSSERELTRQSVPPGAHGAPAFSPDGRWVAFSVSQRSVSEIWATTVDGEELIRLSKAPIQAYDPIYSRDGRYVFFSGRRREIHDLLALPLDEAGRPNGDILQVTSHGLSSQRHVSLSADGERMAFTAIWTRSNLYSLDLSEDGEPVGEPRPLTSGNSRYTRPSFSIDGSRIAYDHWNVGSTAAVWVMNADGSTPLQVTLEQAITTLPSWFPDGRLAYGVRGQNVMRAVNPSQPGEFAEVTGVEEEGLGWMRLSPDGGRIAYHSLSGALNLQIRVLDLATGRSQQLTQGTQMTAFPNWSMDGRWLTAQVERGDSRHVAVIAADGSAEPEILTAEPGQHWSYSFSPDSDKVVYVSDRGGLWNIWWVSRSTGEQKQLTDYRLLNGYVRYPAWSPDGRRIVFELAETNGDIWIATRSTSEP